MSSFDMFGAAVFLAYGISSLRASANLRLAAIFTKIRPSVIVDFIRSILVSCIDRGQLDIHAEDIRDRELCWRFFLRFLLEVLKGFLPKTRTELQKGFPLNCCRSRCSVLQLSGIWPQPRTSLFVVL